MPFVRVKSAVKSDPQHEFDVSVDEYQANKGLYVVVDKEPVAESRPATIAPLGKKPGETKTAPAGAEH